MEAPRSIARGAWPPALAGLVRTLAVSWLALLALAALVLCLRRAGGALTQPLPVPALAACGLLLALAALVFRGIFAGSIPDFDPRRARALWAIPSVVLVLWAIALSLDGSQPAGLVALWGLVLVEEGWSWGRPSTLARRPTPQPIAAVLSPVHQAARPLMVAPLIVAPLMAPTSDGLGSDVADERDATVTQQMTRRRHDDGSESLEGWLRADLAPGARHATAHLAVCPPLERAPECFVEPMDGPSATVKVGQLLVHGVRFEIKLDQVAREPESVWIEFSLQSPPRDG